MRGSTYWVALAGGPRTSYAFDLAAGNPWRLRNASTNKVELPSDARLSIMASTSDE